MGHNDQSWGGHRRNVLSADVCGCFYCLRMFPPSTITEWVDLDADGVGQTALCPRCGIDAVVPSVPARPVIAELLAQLHDRQFGELDFPPKDQQHPKP